MPTPRNRRGIGPDEIAWRMKPGVSRCGSLRTQAIRLVQANLKLLGRSLLGLTDRLQNIRHVASASRQSCRAVEMKVWDRRVTNPA